ncbi:MAG: glycosyltransferase [Pirellulales bacterium]
MHDREERRTESRACLSSVAGLFDEIVVVDTGSTDRTREIAVEHDARVTNFAWCDDFAAARNASLDHATGDWIFWLDADDVLEKDDRTRLSELLLTLGDEPRAIHCRVLSDDAQQAGPTNMATQVRLFRADPKLRWSRRIHEQIVPACERLGYRGEYADVTIHHTGYRDPALVQRKNNRDLRLLRMEYAADPHDAGTLLYLGITLSRMGKSGEALSYLLQGHHVTRESTCDYVSVIYSTLIECLIREGRVDSAWNLTEEATRRFPDDPALAVQRAELLFQHRRTSAAIETLRRHLARPPRKRFYFGSAETFEGVAARTLLARLLIEENHGEEAERILQELLARRPADHALWGYLGAYYLKEMRTADLEYVIRQLEKCAHGPTTADVLRGALALQRGDLDAAERACEAAIERSPEASWPRALYCEVLSNRPGSTARLVAAIEELRRRDPANPLAFRLMEEQRASRVTDVQQWSVDVVM